MARPAVEQYKGLIRQSLDLVGVAGSIERKVLAAVGIQFAVSVALAIAAVLFSGVVQFALTGLLLVGATVAFANTVFITREDLVAPVVTLSERADRIAAGEIDVAIQEISDATDEQAETTQDVVAAVEAVADVSEQTKREAESVAAATQQQTATISEVTGEVRSVAERTDDLHDLLQQFEVTETPSPDADATTDVFAPSTDD